MSNGFVALLTGLGFGTWIYSKVMRYTGGNTKSSVLSGIGAGLAMAFVIFTLFSSID